MKKLIPLLFIVFVLGCAQKTDPQFLVTKIRSVAKLATTEVVVNKIVWSEIKDNRFIGIIKRDETILFDTEATIKFGIDLNKIRPQDITIKGDTLLLKLPKVEIINFSYPHEKFRQIHPISNFDDVRNKRKIEKMDEVFRLAEIDIKEKLKLMNLHTEAENRTVLFMENFLRKMGYTHVYIEFKES